MHFLIVFLLLSVLGIIEPLGQMMDENGEGGVIEAANKAPEAFLELSFIGDFSSQPSTSSEEELPEEYIKIQHVYARYVQALSVTEIALENFLRERVGESYGLHNIKDALVFIRETSNSAGFYSRRIEDLRMNELGDLWLDWQNAPENLKIYRSELRGLLYEFIEKQEWASVHYLSRAVPDLLTLADENANTPLMLALMKKSQPIIDYMWRYTDWNIDQCNNRGETLLVLAAISGNLAIVKELLDKGASPDQKDNYGNTALHFASWYGYKVIVEALLRAGANTSLLGPNGLTAFDCARQRGFSEIIALFYTINPDQSGASIPLNDSDNTISYVSGQPSASPASSSSNTGGAPGVFLERPPHAWGGSYSTFSDQFY